jgi:hypothetical protein
MAGLLFGDWLGPSFARARMSPSSVIEFQQIVHLNYLLTLPALSWLAIAAAVLWLVMVRRRRDSLEFRALLAGAAAIIVGQAITFILNVPINNQLETWSAAAPPVDARAIWSQWERAHVVRTVLWMVGFFLEVVAAVASARLYLPGRSTSSSGVA